MSFTPLDNQIVNNIKVLCADVIQKPNSGHPGSALGMAPLAHVLFSRVLNFDPTDPTWVNRDRFILSSGHVSSLLYVILYLSGYDITEGELQTFRSKGSRLAGHPESYLLPGVEISTGPLGNGIASSVGFAIAQNHLAAKFNKPNFSVVDHFIYVFCGDGCLQEGVCFEACSFAGAMGLGNLIVLYDDNGITIDGPTSLNFIDDVDQRYHSFKWNVLHVKNGDNDYQGLFTTILAAQEDGKKNHRPQFIHVKTTIGSGCTNQGQAKTHGSPLGDPEIEKMKTTFGFDPKVKFFIHPDTKKYYTDVVVPRATHKKAEWKTLLASYATAFPKEYAEYLAFTAAPAPSTDEQIAAVLAKVPKYKGGDKEDSTRKISEAVLNGFAAINPYLIGGSADLACCTFARINSSKYIETKDFSGRNIPYGIREHGMFAIGNGIAAYLPSLLPFVSTFVVFAGYGFGALRIAALSHLPVLHILTHDSVFVGEDGPTHQPVEVIQQLRAFPGVYVYRPADGKEMVGAYLWATEINPKQPLLTSKHPVVILGTRQNVPQLEGTNELKTLKGAYAVLETPNAKKKAQLDAVFVATGSEVALAIAAASLLAASGLYIRVVSAPCLEIFADQPLAYRQSVLLGVGNAPVPILSIEAGVTDGWSRYAHGSVGVNRYGFSAPGGVVYSTLGFTKENVAETAQQLVKYYEGKQVPDKTAPFN